MLLDRYVEYRMVLCCVVLCCVVLCCVVLCCVVLCCVVLCCVVLCCVVFLPSADKCSLSSTQYTGSTLVRGSPNFILSSGMAMPNNYYYYTALAVSKSTAYGSSIAILSALVGVKCVGKPM